MHSNNMTVKELLQQDADSDLCKAMQEALEKQILLQADLTGAVDHSYRALEYSIECLSDLIEQSKQ